MIRNVLIINKNIGKVHKRFLAIFSSVFFGSLFFVPFDPI